MKYVFADFIHPGDLFSFCSITPGVEHNVMMCLSTVISNGRAQILTTNKELISFKRDCESYIYLIHRKEHK